MRKDNARAPSGNARGSNLQKVYGNIVDLVGFEEQHLTDQLNPRGATQRSDKQRRGQSGKPGGRKVGGGFETIYLN